MHPTAFDPDVPVIPDEAIIVSVDRIASPYNPEAPRYIQKDSLGKRCRLYYQK